MQFETKNFRDINVNQIEPGNFVDKTKWIESIGKFKELKLFIDEMLRIMNLSQEIPAYLKTIATSYATTFISYLNQLTEEKTGQPAEIANQKEQVFRQFDGWYRECIEKTNNRSEQISFYEVFNTLKNLEKNNFEKELTEITNVKNKINSDKDSIDIILKELQKKTSNITMSDYARIFGDESDSHKLMAWIWLGVGVLLSVLFLAILIFTDWYNKFPTEEIIGNNSTVKYNISNLLIKLLIFAVQIFLISFSFKQYSISKHLNTINKHRQNGLDSFKLFVESISKDDSETRNSLMLQLAKAIYEQTSTGYIGDKNQNFNSGIVEITKMIGANKLE